MTVHRVHRAPLVPHPFTPDTDIRDWHGEHTFCSRCGFPEHSKIHADYEAPEDLSDRILGEHDADAA